MQKVECLDSFCQKNCQEIMLMLLTNDKFFVSFLNKCISEGIYFAPSKFEAGFISTKHTKKIIDDV